VQTETTAPTTVEYRPPAQSRLGQWIDAAVLLVLVFGALYAPVLLGWTSPAARVQPVSNPTWESLHQNPTMVAQWQKLGYDPAKAAPLIESRFDYRIDPIGLTATALLLIGYFAFVLVVAEREYRGVIAEKFGPPSTGKAAFQIDIPEGEAASLCSDSADFSDRMHELTASTDALAKDTDP
jgi:hypothetical protein